MWGTDRLYILFIGDIVGKPGRYAVKSILPTLRRREGYDAVVANAENAAGGFGLTAPVAAELFAAGVDLITLGNHAFTQRNVAELLAGEKRIIRPANYPEGTQGQGSVIHECANGKSLGVLNLLGRVFLEPLDDPFRIALRELLALRETTPYCLLDFHAEATSEKIAMAWMVDGLAAAVIGTHTHVQTADERILPGGTGYITDVGMTGPTDGVLGVDRELVLRKFRTQMPVKFALAEGPVALDAVSLVFNTDGHTVKIERMHLGV